MTVKEATIIVIKYGKVPDHPEFISPSERAKFFEAKALLKKKKVNKKLWGFSEVNNQCCVSRGNNAFCQYSPGDDCETIPTFIGRSCAMSSVCGY